MKQIKAYRKFRRKESVVIVSGDVFKGEIGTVRCDVGARVVLDVQGYCCSIYKENVMREEEAKEQAMNPKVTVQQEQVAESMWALMGGYPACMNCGCSPAEWEDGFPPYCHSCGARMKNGRK